MIIYLHIHLKLIQFWGYVVQTTASDVFGDVIYYSKDSRNSYEICSLELTKADFLNVLKQLNELKVHELQ